MQEKKKKKKVELRLHDHVRERRSIKKGRLCRSHIKWRRIEQPRPATQEKTTKRTIEMNRREEEEGEKEKGMRTGSWKS